MFPPMSLRFRPLWAIPTTAAVAILPTGRSPALVVVARAPDQSKANTELADLEVPLAQLFQTQGQSSSSEPVFNDRQVAGVTGVISFG